MNTDRTAREFVGGCCVGVLMLVLAGSGAQIEAQPQWTIFNMDDVLGVKTRVNDFAIGAEGVPWVMFSDPHHTIYYRQNGEWRKLEGDFQTGAYYTGLYTSPTGKVYMSQQDRNSSDHKGLLYLLEQGNATYVTDYYLEERGNYPKLYFDSKDRIWNWGQMFVARYEKGEWKRVETSLGSAYAVENSLGEVYFFGKERFCCYRNGTFETNVQMPKMPLSDLPHSYTYELLGDDKAVFISYHGKGIAVVDLETLEVDSSLMDDPVFSQALMCELFRDRLGNVWVLVDPYSGPCHYVVISARNGTTQKLPDTAAVKWQGFSHRLESILNARDGAVYFGPPGDGVYILRDDRLAHVGWKQGVPLNSVQWVLEGGDSRIWFACSRAGIAVYDPGGIAGEGPVTRFAESWQEYTLANRGMLADGNGNIWCCLENHPRAVSRWDGHQWRHFDISADMAKTTAFLIDDKGRIHTWSYVFAEGVYRLVGTKVDHFANMKDMLVDSVRGGSRSFRSSAVRQLVAPIVTANGEIWYAQPGASRISRFDGRQWFDFGLGERATSIRERQDGTVVVRTWGGSFSVEGGKMAKAIPERESLLHYMLGENGPEPFDKGIYEKQKDAFYLACRTDRGEYVLERGDRFSSLETKASSQEVKFSRYTEEFWFAEGGFWAHSDNLPELIRYYRGMIFNVDLAPTPIGRHLGANHCGVRSDPAGNLWIRNGAQLFKIKQGRIETLITSPRKALYERRRLRIDFAGERDGRKDDDLGYCWRLDDGGWSEPSEKKYAELTFAEPGRHKFEVVAVGEMANVDPSPAVLEFTVTIPYPQVQILTVPQGAVDGTLVTIRYEVVRQEPESDIAFQWRLDGGGWNHTTKTEVDLRSLEDAAHSFEVRAVQDMRYFQPVPARVTFTTKTDHEAIILREIERLKSEAYAGRDAAATALVLIGERALPYLKDELESATGDTQWWLRSVIWQIEHRMDPAEPALRN